MSIEDRQRWDLRHTAPVALTPRASVLALPEAAPGAVALDVACGQGRHAAVLLDKGYRVVACDVSRVALGHAKQRAGDTSRARFLAVQADADAWPFASSCFDLVVQVDFLDRALLGTLAASLRPGGLLLIDTFLDLGRPNAEGPRSPAFLLRPGELPRSLPSLQVVRDDEEHGETGRATLLARRP